MGLIKLLSNCPGMVVAIREYIIQDIIPMDHLFSTVVNSTYTSLFYFGPVLVVNMSGLKESQHYEYVKEFSML